MAVANGVEFIDRGDESRKIRKIISEDMINRGRWFYHLQINTLQISWQGLQDNHQTYCGLISFPDEEGRDNAYHLLKSKLCFIFDCIKAI